MFSRFSDRILNRRLMFGVGALFCLLICSSDIAQAAQDAQAVEVKAKTIEIPFKSHDGHEMFGKLVIPDSKGRHALVIYVQTAEGMTVDMKRPGAGGTTFNYFDLYRKKLPEMNVAFFSYEGRGIRLGDKPPRYETIDWNVYNTSTLENKVRDILSAVQVVKKQSGIDASQIFLMGSSEGTLLAAEAAARLPKQIKGLILYGVMSSNMRETFKFVVGDGAFLAYRGFFDKDKDGKISKAEFEEDPRKYRENVFKNAGFNVFDHNGDGFWTADETKVLSKSLIEAADKDNYAILDSWAKNSAGVSTPKDWFKDHFSHEPIWAFLSRLDMQVGFFQGDKDTACSIEGVKLMEAQAKKAGKSKMEFHYFENLDHSLNIGAYFVRGTLPAGHKAIFEYISKQVRKN